ncbi:Protein SYS1-like protein [Armadillidium nasatum]|uniref:Protein SYS1-like protein n=1 Tax=Armadillidium nasatum TaxID=96803 RepID=A0A5N5TNF9_9CRUS|nr:Protein SYS1-like protein [Armadillidium nasatum]
MSGSFRYKIWDPPLIISQILTMQAIYYIGLGLWIAILDIFTGHHRSLDSIFKYQEIQFKENQGRAIMLFRVMESCTTNETVFRFYCDCPRPALMWLLDLYGLPAVATLHLAPPHSHDNFDVCSRRIFVYEDRNA